MLICEAHTTPTTNYSYKSSNHHNLELANDIFIQLVPKNFKHLGLSPIKVQLPKH